MKHISNTALVLAILFAAASVATFVANFRVIEDTSRALASIAFGLAIIAFVLKRRALR